MYTTNLHIPHIISKSTGGVNNIGSNPLLTLKPHGDIDDDDDIINPFKIVSEPDDDTDVKFDEEDQDRE